jgi:hypothetical protein
MKKFLGLATGLFWRNHFCLVGGGVLFAPALTAQSKAQEANIIRMANTVPYK